MFIHGLAQHSLIDGPLSYTLAFPMFSMSQCSQMRYVSRRRLHDQIMATNKMGFYAIVLSYDLVKARYSKYYFLVIFLH